MFFFPLDSRTSGFETAMVIEPSVFEPLKFHCIYFEEENWWNYFIAPKSGQTEISVCPLSGVLCNVFHLSFRKQKIIAKLYVQSTLVISTSVISNNRLSRRENLVLVLTQKSKIRLQNIVEKRRNCSPKEEKLLLGSNFSPFPQYFQYIFLSKGVKLHSHL